MEGDLVYPPKTYPRYPTVNTVQPYYPPPTPPPHHFLPPPSDGLGFPPNHYPYYPMANGYQYPYPSLHLHLHPPHQTRKATDSKVRSKARKARHLHLYLPHPTFQIALLLSLSSLGDHPRVAIWSWKVPWRSVPVHEGSPLRVHPCHVSCPYSRCRPQSPWFLQRPAL